MREEAPNYLINLVSKCEPTIRTTNLPSTVEYIVSSTLFFPFTLNDSFNLDLNIRNSESISLFKNRLLSFIHPGQRSIYNIFDPRDLKFLIDLRLGLSHLNEHRFRHKFQSDFNLLSSCSLCLCTAITFHTIILIL